MQTVTISKPSTIADVCASSGVIFHTGCGYYQLTKSEKVSAGKDMVAVSQKSGQQIVGSKAVREKLELASGDITIAPKSLKPGWTLYVQSTSSNRKLPTGTSVLIPASGGATSSSSAASSKRQSSISEAFGAPAKKVAKTTGASKTLRGAEVPVDWDVVGGSMLVKRHGACKAQPRIAAFDYDDTLAKTSVAGFDPNAWKMMFPNVPTVLKKLHASGHKIVVITNESMDRFKDVDVVKKAVLKKTGRLEGFAKACSVPMQFLCATSKDDYRKPNTGAWKFLTKEGNDGVKPLLDSCFFVGDAAGRPKDHSDSDKAFAKAVGITFHTETEFFKEIHK